MNSSTTLSQPQTPKDAYLAGFKDSKDIRILNEVLQKEANPIDFLKKVEEKKLVVVVPFEWGWPQQLKPFTNAEHQRYYDAESLSHDLALAGFHGIVRLLDFDSWQFLTAEVVKKA